MKSDDYNNDKNEAGADSLSCNKRKLVVCLYGEAQLLGPSVRNSALESFVLRHENMMPAD